jgi:hypothetical protein
MKHPIFVIGSGRCGSTLVSHMLRKHPGVLSLSELFISLAPLAFSRDPIDGAGLWHVLSSPRPSQKAILGLMRHGIDVTEILYPRGPSTRFDMETGVPPIMLGCLPHLTDDPEGLHDEVRTFVLSLPMDRLGLQYRRLFDWLRMRFDRKVWVERSGASLGFIGPLSQVFPDAKFIHLTRDGRECAMSMSRFPPFRLDQIMARLETMMGVNPYLTSERPRLQELPPEWRALLPESFDAETFQKLDLPIENFGAMWNGLVMSGLEHLSRLPEAQVLSMRYESLLESPRSELQRLIRFIDPGLEQPEWLDSATALVRNKPLTWVRLPSEQRERLEASCQPALKALGYTLS